jgi:hypothetical protein
MAPGSASGTYTATVTITGAYEWRASFAKPPGEGIGAANSAWVAVAIVTCTICPAANGLGAPE